MATDGFRRNRAPRRTPAWDAVKGDRVMVDPFVHNGREMLEQKGTLTHVTGGGHFVDVILDSENGKHRLSIKQVRFLHPEYLTHPRNLPVVEIKDATNSIGFMMTEISSGEHAGATYSVDGIAYTFMAQVTSPGGTVLREELNIQKIINAWLTDMVRRAIALDKQKEAPSEQ